MSKIDKMFEELGFIRNDDGRYPTYRKGEITLMFDVDDEVYRISEYFSPTNMRQSVPINITLHNIINEKMKELGWL